MSEWREFEKFDGFDFEELEGTAAGNGFKHVAVFSEKVSVRKDMVGAFEVAFDLEHSLTRIYLKFGDSLVTVKCPYPEFYDWVTT